VKILFCISHLNYWLPIQNAAFLLHDKGHQIEVLFDPSLRGKFESRFHDDSFERHFDVGDMYVRRDVWGRSTEWLREFVNFLSYYTYARKPFSQKLADRWLLFLSLRLWRLKYWRSVNRFLASPIIYNLLKRLAKSAPCSRNILADLKSKKPDLVIASPVLLNYSKEYEYLKAAQSLKIPTGIIIPSWDNLTTKGIFHIIPDKIFVWNESQVTEAKQIFGIPRERLCVTGAPRYDGWFEMTVSRTRSEVESMLGINSGDNYFLWLCSSVFIAGIEMPLIKKCSKAFQILEAHNQLQLVVRPHFQNFNTWEGSKCDKINVWPEPDNLKSFNLKEFHQDFFDSIFYSSGVIGINTSAFLEAAIVDKPCLTITPSEYIDSQAGLPHFEHLVKAGFLENSQTLDGLMANILSIANGRDALKDNRKRFVKQFLRPRSIDCSSSSQLAKEILNIQKQYND